MKKSLILALFALLFSNALNAQTPKTSGFKLYERDYKICIGPKVGVGIAMGSVVTMFDFKASPGLSYQAGMAVNAHFGHRSSSKSNGGGTGWFGAEAEALYSVRNLKMNEAAVRINCLEIPLLAQLYPISELGIEAGVTMVKVLNFTPDLLQSDYFFLHTGQISGGDVMLTAGLCFKAGGMMMDLRFNKGVSGLADNFDAKISSLVLSMVYLISVVK